MGRCVHCHRYKVESVTCTNCGRKICETCAKQRDERKACHYRGGYYKPFDSPVMIRTPERRKEDAIAENFETPSNYEVYGEEDQ